MLCILKILVMCMKVNNEACFPYVMLSVCHDFCCICNHKYLSFLIIQLVHVKMVTPQGIIEKNCQVIQYI